MSAAALPLVLASSSSYRRQLLQKLGLPFTCGSPDIDETPRRGETPSQLVARLAVAKARELANQFPEALIIGSDQVAMDADGQPLGKPHTVEKAVKQLQLLSGRRVTFVTGLCLLNSRSGREQCVVESFDVQFRCLQIEQIERYVTREMPLDCAGSFKSEGLGITLFEGLYGRDPNALVGLPLMALVTMLGAEGVCLP